MDGLQGTASAFRVRDWVVLSDGAAERVWAREDQTWDAVELTGELARALQAEPEDLRTMRGLGMLQPALARLADCLAAGPKQQLTLGGLLQGQRWELLFLELTGQCNERCVHCYAESSPERSEHLSLAEVEGVLRDAATLGFQTVQLTGGDPLVSRTYLDAARLARGLGIPRIEVYTNGLALSDRVADELAEVGVDYSMSFFSHRPQVHDQITGTPGSQVRTAAAIERVLRRGARLRIGLISTATNRSDVPQTFDWLVSLGVDPSRIGIDEERGVGRGNYLAAGDLVRRGVSSRQRGQGSEVSAHGSLPLRGGKLCVSYRGHVFPCIFARRHRLGSIREQSLGDVLRQPVHLRPRATIEGPAASQADLTCRECREASRVLDASVWGSVGEHSTL